MTVCVCVCVWVDGGHDSCPYYACSDEEESEEVSSALDSYGFLDQEEDDDDSDSDDDGGWVSVWVRVC